MFGAQTAAGITSFFTKLRRAIRDCDSYSVYVVKLKVQSVKTVHGHGCRAAITTVAYELQLYKTIGLTVSMSLFLSKTEYEIGLPYYLPYISTSTSR